MVRRLDDGDVLTLEGKLFARAAPGGDGAERGDGEVALGKDIHHFLADNARCAENTDVYLLHG